MSPMDVVCLCSDSGSDSLVVFVVTHHFGMSMLE